MAEVKGWRPSQVLGGTWQFIDGISVRMALMKAVERKARLRKSGVTLGMDDPLWIECLARCVEMCIWNDCLAGSQGGCYSFSLTAKPAEGF